MGVDGRSPGDPAGELYADHAPRMLGWFRAQGVPEPEDLVGEVFLQVARDLNRFEGDDEALRRWVFAIGYHRMLDDRRARSRRPVTADAPLPERPHHDADGLDPELAAALDRLTADQREVVVLRFVADLPIEAVAEITRRRVTAVKALQRRALRSLARALDLDG